MKVGNALTGGGIPGGIIEAIFQNYINQHIIPDIQYAFDAISAVSAGAIYHATTSLNPTNTNDKKYYSPKDAIDFFKEYGPKIFKQVKHPFYKKYRRSFYKGQTLSNIIESEFSGATLKDFKTPTVIPAYNLNQYKGKTVFLDSTKSKTSDISVAKAIKATCGFPIYFDGTDIDPFDGYFIDGGVGYDNPIILAYEKLTEMETSPQEPLILISMGFSRDLGFNANNIKNKGVIEWIDPRKSIPIANILQNESIARTLREIELLKKYRQIHYYNLVPNIDQAAIKKFGTKFSLDDASPKAILGCSNFAENFIEKNELLFSAVCDEINLRYNEKTQHSSKAALNDNKGVIQLNVPKEGHHLDSETRVTSFEAPSLAMKQN